jgi:hypothetical protein
MKSVIKNHGQISDEGLFDVDFSRTSIAQENSASTPTTYLIGKELMLRECRDWGQGAKLTGIIKTDFYEGKGRLVKDFHNSFVLKIIWCGNFVTILLTLN